MKRAELQRKTPLRRGTPLNSAESGLKRGPGPSRKTPLGHCTPAQKERVAEQVCCVCGAAFNACEPAHVVPRGHPRVSHVAADDVRAVVPLCHWDHRLFDEGKIDLLPYLEPAWRDSQEWAAGAVGLATAYRAITGDRMAAA